MAAVSLLWNTNMAAATSCENALIHILPELPPREFLQILQPLFYCWIRGVEILRLARYPLQPVVLYPLPPLSPEQWIEAYFLPRNILLQAVSVKALCWSLHLSVHVALSASQLSAFPKRKLIYKLESALKIITNITKFFVYVMWRIVQTEESDAANVLCE